MIALRHVCGNFDADKDDDGTAVDMNRVFIDGEDMAAQAAARFAELFAGAVLRHSDGTATNGPNLREVGGVAGLPAYCVVYPKRAVEQRFAEALAAANAACVIETVEEKDAPGDAAKIHAWLLALPPRDSQPRDIRYTVHGAAYQRHFWINVLEFDGSVKPAPEFHATADRAANLVRVETVGITRFELFLNDLLVDLSKEVRVVVVEDGKEYEFLKLVPTRDMGTMLQELVESNHPWRIYPVRLVVDVPVLKKRLAEQEAAAAAKKAAPADASVGG
jgi:hypothetical protein